MQLFKMRQNDKLFKQNLFFNLLIKHDLFSTTKRSDYFRFLVKLVDTDSKDYILM